MFGPRRLYFRRAYTPVSVHIPSNVDPEHLYNQFHVPPGLIEPLFDSASRCVDTFFYAFLCHLVTSQRALRPGLGPCTALRTPICQLYHSSSLADSVNLSPIELEGASEVHACGAQETGTAASRPFF